MKLINTRLYSILIFSYLFSGVGIVFAEQSAKAEGMSFERARWHPSHFQPAINNTTNELSPGDHRTQSSGRVACGRKSE